MLPISFSSIPNLKGFLLPFSKMPIPVCLTYVIAFMHGFRKNTLFWSLPAKVKNVLKKYLLQISKGVIHQRGNCKWQNHVPCLGKTGLSMGGYG